MYKETKYIFCDRPYYEITVSKSLAGNINIEFQLEKDDSFVMGITQNQASRIATKLADYGLSGHNVLKKEKGK